MNGFMLIISGTSISVVNLSVDWVSYRLMERISTLRVERKVI